MELSFDQLEEGEIRDDFEDISDNSDSLVDLTRGKFVSTNESLRALSLSSVSDFDDTENDENKKKSPRYYHVHHHHHQRHVHDHNNKKLHHHHHRHHQKKKAACSVRKRTSSSGSSSEDDTVLDDSLKNKLKEAVRIESSVKQNSLQTRLAKLLQKEPEQALEQEPEEVEQGKEQPEPLTQIRDNLQTTQEIINSEKIDDNELEALRLEALKTAVLNKCQIRKKKKLEALEAAKALPDKENEPEELVPVQEQDEDLDALRANLLANLKKKTPSPKKPAVAVAPQPVAKVTKVTKQFKTQVIVNNITKKINKVRPLPMPCVVAPLIISLRDDSDSDEPSTEVLPVAPANPPVSVQPDMSKIDQFLAEARATAEAMQQASATETDTLPQAKATPQRLPPTAPKSAVKLLPKSQQLEYQHLLRQLKTAEERKKRKLARAKAQIAKRICPLPPALPRAVEPPQLVPPPQIVESVVVPIQNGFAKQPDAVSVSPVETDAKSESPSGNNESAESFIESTTDKGAEEASLKAAAELTAEFTVERVIEHENKKSGVLKDVAILHGLLKEIRTNKNGRLQMRSKYQVLTPIVKKIMDVNNERKRHEADIKDLMNELIALRCHLANTHEKFSTLVGELSNQKLSVDLTKTKAVAQSKNVATPLRTKPEEPPVTSTPTVQITPSAINNQVEDMDVCNSEDNSDTMCHHIDIMDPNDIDQIFPRKQFPHHLNFPEYVSPLNNCERYDFVDPQGVMCPFELSGFCRDTECTFKHYLMK